LEGETTGKKLKGRVIAKRTVKGTEGKRKEPPAQMKRKGGVLLDARRPGEGLEDMGGKRERISQVGGGEGGGLQSFSSKGEENRTKKGKRKHSPRPWKIKNPHLVTKEKKDQRTQGCVKGGEKGLSRFT